MLNPEEKIQELMELSENIREFVAAELYRLNDDTGGDKEPQGILNDCIVILTKELQEFGIYLDLSPEDYLEEWSLSEGIIALRKYFTPNVFNMLLRNTARGLLTRVRTVIENIEAEEHDLIKEILVICEELSPDYPEDLTYITEYVYSDATFKEYLEYTMADAKQFENPTDVETILTNQEFFNALHAILVKGRTAVLAVMRHVEHLLPLVNHRDVTQEKIDGIQKRYLREWTNPDTIGKYNVISSITDTKSSESIQNLVKATVEQYAYKLPCTLAYYKTRDLPLQKIDALDIVLHIAAIETATIMMRADDQLKQKRARVCARLCRPDAEDLTVYDRSAAIQEVLDYINDPESSVYAYTEAVAENVQDYIKLLCRVEEGRKKEK